MFISIKLDYWYILVLFAIVNGKNKFFCELQTKSTWLCSAYTFLDINIYKRYYKYETSNPLSKLYYDF